MDLSSHLNNLGAAAAEDGHYSLAVELLGKALDAKLATISCTSSESSPIPHRSGRLVQEQSSKIRVHHRESAMSCQTLSSCAFIYRRTFFLEVNEEENAVSEKPNDVYASTSCTIKSAVLLFNLALTFHMKAGRKRVDRYTDKSKTLYRMALGLVKDILDSPNCHLLDTRLVLAILNNLGEIYHEQGEYELTRKSFFNLSCVLQSVRASGGNTLIDRNDWSGFVLNTMMFADMTLAAAA